MTIKGEICQTVKVDARLMGDGTLWIKTDKIADIGRVIVEDGKMWCKQFYQDAQPELHYDEWCHSCKEYDQEKHCCPRFNRVIKSTVDELKSAQPEIIYCEDCVHNIGPEFGFCDRANHHVSANSCCADVFHAERREK